MKRILITLVALFLSAVPLSAQTYLTSTTLTNAITSATADTLVVGSTTTAAVGGYIYVDREAMLILAVNGSTGLRVARGQQGTAAGTHAASATVIIFPVAALTGQYPAFGQADPVPGSCTPGNYRYLPIVNVTTGNVWLCRYIAAAAVSRTWAYTNVVFGNGTSSLLINLQ